MKRILLLVLFGFGYVLAWGQPAAAAAREWEVDKAHSNIYFTVDHVYSKVRGHFNEFTSTMAFDPANLKESRFAFEIKVGSIDTNIEKRDKHLLSPDFFDAAKYPAMTFTSTAITEGGKGVYNVAGKLTVKGKEHDLTLPLTLAGVKEHPAMPGKQVIGFNGTITVDRLALQIGDDKFYKMGLVGKDVEVLVTIEALSAK